MRIKWSRLSHYVQVAATVAIFVVLCHMVFLGPDLSASRSPKVYDPLDESVSDDEEEALHFQAMYEGLTSEEDTNTKDDSNTKDASEDEDTLESRYKIAKGNMKKIIRDHDSTPAVLNITSSEGDSKINDKPWLRHIDEEELVFEEEEEDEKEVELSQVKSHPAKFPDATTIVQEVAGYIKKDFTKHTRMKRILYWTSWWHKEAFLGTGQKPFLKAKCPVDRCELVSDHSLLNVSDALLIHINMAPQPSMFPKYRSANQVYIFFNFEPPRKVPDLGRFPGLFNATWTYRQDSDMYRPIGKILPLSNREKRKIRPRLPENYAAGKDILVSWVVSNCNASSGRDWFAEQLNKHIPVNIYGKCGPLECPHHDDCMTDIMNRSKFYLAFENALCKDYITEKVWRSLQSSTVPVVLGYGDYKHILPAHSYIDVNSFKSMWGLARYLNKLHQNDTLYNQYFHWRKNFKVKHHFPFKESMCAMCAYLHDNEHIIKVIEDLDGWFGEKGSCMDKKTFFKNIRGIPW